MTDPHYRSASICLLPSRTMRNPRFFPALVTAVLVGALAGGLFGSKALARQDRVAEKYQLFTTALSEVQANYVEQLPSDRLVYSAIDGLLKQLDPHSSFMDPRTYAQLRERQEGLPRGHGPGGSRLRSGLPADVHAVAGRGVIRRGERAGTFSWLGISGKRAG